MSPNGMEVSEAARICRNPIPRTKGPAGLNGGASLGRISDFTNPRQIVFRVDEIRRRNQRVSVRSRTEKRPLWRRLGLRAKCTI
jgi:hypothetical protein